MMILRCFKSQWEKIKPLSPEKSSSVAPFQIPMGRIRTQYFGIRSTTRERFKSQWENPNSRTHTRFLSFVFFKSQWKNPNFIMRFKSQRENSEQSRLLALVIAQPCFKSQRENSKLSGSSGYRDTTIVSNPNGKLQYC